MVMKHGVAEKYATRWFITMLTTAGNWSLPSDRQIQSILWLFKIHFNVILKSMPKSFNCVLPFRFHIKNVNTFIISHMHATRYYHVNGIAHPNSNKLGGVQITKEVSPCCYSSLSIITTNTS
jgi:hypothetical protein